MSKKIIVIGLDDNEDVQLSEEIKLIIASTDYFSGGKRHYEIVKNLLSPKDYWKDITIPLADVFDTYRKWLEKTDTIIVFASGDPLFFGIGNTIRREIPEVELITYPVFNSLQTLAHRLSMRYDDMTIVSLTGRPWREMEIALIERKHKIGVLTDRKNTPSYIAQRLLDYGYDYYDIYVGVHLGNKEKEEVLSLTLKEASEMEFKHPNNIILNAKIPKEQLITKREFGIEDERFMPLEGRKRMITKSAIRLLTLQALELYKSKTFWDIGFCTGSVSIEAKLMFPYLNIVSFEIREEGKVLMDVNSKRFGAIGIETVIGDFLKQDLSRYPKPDAVFIGGHGGKLKDILKKLSLIVTEQGRIVFNSVSEESRQLFITATQEMGWNIKEQRTIKIDDYNEIIQIKI